MVDLPPYHPANSRQVRSAKRKGASRGREESEEPHKMADDDSKPEEVATRTHMSAMRSNIVIFWCAFLLRYNAQSLNQLNEEVKRMEKMA